MSKSIRFIVFSLLTASSFALAAPADVDCGKPKPEDAKLAEDLTNLILSKLGSTRLRSAWEFDSSHNPPLKEVRADGSVSMSGDIDFDLLSAKPSPQKDRPFVHIASKDMKAIIKVDRKKNTKDDWEGSVSFKRANPAADSLSVQVTLNKARVYDWKISGLRFEGKDILDPNSNPKIIGSCDLKNRLATFSPDGTSADIEEVKGSCLYAFTYDKKCNRWVQKFRYNDIDPESEGAITLPSTH